MAPMVILILIFPPFRKLVLSNKPKYLALQYYQALFESDSLMKYVIYAGRKMQENCLFEFQSIRLQIRLLPFLPTAQLLSLLSLLLLDTFSLRLLKKNCNWWGLRNAIISCQKDSTISLHSMSAKLCNKWIYWMWSWKMNLILIHVICFSVWAGDCPMSQNISQH